MSVSPSLAAAMRLLDTAKAQGFNFRRITLGEDGPLVGRRESVRYKDEIYIGGFSDSCYAIRAFKYSLIVPDGLPVTARVTGGVLTVLHAVTTDWSL